MYMYIYLYLLASFSFVKFIGIESILLYWYHNWWLTSIIY